MAGLLVSVRNASEAGLALLEGVDLIDLKEPGLGSLGASDPATWDQVAQIVGGKKPLSAALGELRDWEGQLPQPDYTYLKWGLSGLGGSSLRSLMSEAFGIAEDAGHTPVAVAYADYQVAKCPPPLEILEIGASLGSSVLLVDTWSKDGKHLLDWLDLDQLATLRHRTSGMGMKLALAGSLNFDLVETIQPIQADWLAVRGAVCDGGRSGPMDVEKVRKWVRKVAEL